VRPLRLALVVAGFVLLPGAGVAGPARGDPVAGEAVYSRCLACHALAYDRTGPRHCGLLGRRAGSVKGFAYSQALKRANFVWTEETLDRFIADPTRTVPGTSMGYDGVKDPGERADLLAFLKRADASADCRKDGTSR
jgi:cytochrome c